MATKAAMTLAEIVAQETTERITKQVTEQVTLSNKKESIKEDLEARFGTLDTEVTEQMDRIENVVQLRNLLRQTGIIQTLHDLKFPQDPSGEGKAEGES